VTTGANSGWITNTYWDSDNLSYGKSYSFKVKAKNGEGIETGWTLLGKKSTLGCITILQPKGGEVISSGSTYTIQWDTCSEAVSFDLYYSLNRGASWTLISRNVTGTNNIDWKVPKVTVDKKACLIKVVGYNGARTKKIGTDISDKPFTIEK
jgi:hypothetical protein